MVEFYPLFKLDYGCFGDILVKKMTPTDCHSPLSSIIKFKNDLRDCNKILELDTIGIELII